MEHIEHEHLHLDEISQEHGDAHTHCEHTHGPHGHTHSHEHTRAVVNRLSRAIGHLQRVKSMVEDGHDCAQVLIQLAAVRNAINNTGKVILRDHLEHCVVDAIEHHDYEAIQELNAAIEQFVK